MTRKTHPLKSDPPKRPLVLDAFRRRHQEGLPFNQRDVAKDAECSGTLVSLYCKDYVRQVADRLLEEKIETDQDHERWRREFLTLRAFFNNTDRREELFRKWVEIHINHIHRSGRLPTCTEVKRLCGSTDRAIRNALDYWSAQLGIPLQHAEIWKKISIEEVLARVDNALHRLPLTFLESEAFGIPFTDRQRRMIHNIRSQSLRNTAFFVMAFADRNRPNDMRFFTLLDKMMSALGIHEYPDINSDTFYEEYHEKRLLPDHSDSLRLDFLQTYFRLIRRQADYLRKLNDTQRALVEPFLLYGLTDDHFWRHSPLKLARDEERIGRRKAQVAVVHAKFYQLREVAERRYQLVDRLCKAYAQAVEAARQGVRMPLHIQLEEDVFMPGRPTGRMTFKLLLWDGPSLKKAHKQIGDRGYYDTREGNDHPSSGTDQFYLSYDNTAEAVGSSARYWFSQLLSAGFSQGDARLASLGFSRSAFNTLPRASVPTPVLAWHRVLRDHTEIEFLPIDLCMTCCLVGNAAVQIMTKTGARANEFLQIRLDPQHLVQADLPNNAQAITFHAIPKGRQAEEPFYIDERCMKALFSWWKYRTGMGYSFAHVQATRALQQKLKPANYLWQLDAKHIDHREINGAMMFLLFDVPLESANGAKIQLTSHLLRHSFATEMRALDTPIDVLALLMKQRDTSVTAYYSRPTPPMLVEFQRRIFEKRLDLTRTHRRSAGQIKRQIEDAMEKVGALAPVVGGTCTVANACPAAFACLGCFGNAPDAKKREQVIEYKTRYTELADLARTRNLPHEQRKAMDVVANCNDMLSEMDCIDAADRASNEPLAISLADNRGKSI